MLNQKNKITQRQLMYFMIQTQIGVAILSLPYKVQMKAKGGAWISIIIAGLVVQVNILLLWAVCRRYPSHTIYGFLPQIIGKYAGTTICFAYIGYFLLSASTIVANLTNILGKWVLPKTPRWIMVLLTLVTAVYLAKESVRIISRVFVIVTFVIVSMVILTLIAYTDINLYYLFPVTEEGWGTIFKAAYAAFWPFGGYEIFLAMYPFVEGKSNGILKAMWAGNLLVTLFYTFEVFSCLIIFSPEQFPYISEPLLYMLKGYTFHFIERIDLIFLATWIVVATTSVISALWMGAMGFGHLFHKGEHKISVFYAALICYIIVMFARDETMMDRYDTILKIGHHVLVVALPSLLLVLSYLIEKKKGEQK